MILNLDFDNSIYLDLEEENAYAFISGSFYKLYLKRYVESVTKNKVHFKKTLTYLNYKKIISILKKRYKSIEIDSNLTSFINNSEMHVEERSRLGLELKKHDLKLNEKFIKYKNIVDENMIRPLREQQMWDSFYLCVMRKASNFSVPGSGKTAAVLGMYAYLRASEKVNKIVVVSPKNAFGSWIDEYGACFGNKFPLNSMNIHDSKYKNAVSRQNALKYDSSNCNLILINYESVGGVEDALLEVINDKTILVFDEVHKVKRINGEYASHALKLAQKAKYVVAMTGTPLPNSYLDIYNLFHILFPYEYDTFFNFSISMLKNPNRSDVENVNDKLQPFFCRTSKEQLGVPKANADEICMYNSSDVENDILNILQMKYKKNKLALLIRIMQLESNPKLLLQNLNLRDFQYLLDDSVDVDEIDFADYSEEMKKLINSCGDSQKFIRCVDLSKKLVQQGKTVIIWCVFVDSIKRISEELNRCGIKTRQIYGEVALEERQQILQQFRDKEIQVLITNPHTLAESVSLHSVCHDAIYFEYSYNLVHLLQSKDRIHRLGLKEGQYTQYYFMSMQYEVENKKWSMDDIVYNRLKEKEKIMLNAIDRNELETMPTSKEDLDVIFAELFE